jgi:hypothetical protein
MLRSFLTRGGELCGLVRSREARIARDHSLVLECARTSEAFELDCLNFAPVPRRLDRKRSGSLYGTLKFS